MLSIYRARCVVSGDLVAGRSPIGQVRYAEECCESFDFSEGASVRVARLYGTGDIRVGDEPEPAGSVRPREDDEALVRVTAVGICGSDLHWWTEGAIGDAELSRPLVLGHEAAGAIAWGPQRGQRVAIDPAIP